MKMYYECKKNVHLPSVKATLAQGDVISVENGKITLESGLSFDVADDFTVMLNAGFFIETKDAPAKKLPVAEDKPEPTFHVIDEEVDVITKFAETKKDFEEESKKEDHSSDVNMKTIEFDTEPFKTIPIEGTSKTASDHAGGPRNTIHKENGKSKEDARKAAEQKKRAREESIRKVAEAKKASKAESKKD